jgi:hypothetical protein
MAIELLGHSEDVVVRLLVVDQNKIEFPAGIAIVEGLRVAQMIERLAVAGYIGVQAAQIADESPPVRQRMSG